jgi:hypothetical protein
MVIAVIGIAALHPSFAMRVAFHALPALTRCTLPRSELVIAASPIMQQLVLIAP